MANEEQYYDVATDGTRQPPDEDQFYEIPKACQTDDLNDFTFVMRNYPKHMYIKMLHICVKFECPKICRYLLQNIDHVNVKDSNGKTPLHSACAHSNVKVVKLLCGRPDIRIHARDAKGRTALHFACTNKKNVDMVQLLLSMGADIFAKDFDDETPFSIACSKDAHLIIGALFGHDQRVILNAKRHHMVKYVCRVFAKIFVCLFLVLLLLGSIIKYVIPLFLNLLL